MNHQCIVTNEEEDERFSDPRLRKHHRKSRGAKGHTKWVAEKVFPNSKRVSTLFVWINKMMPVVTSTPKERTKKIMPTFIIVIWAVDMVLVYEWRISFRQLIKRQQPSVGLFWLLRNLKSRVNFDCRGGFRWSCCCCPWFHDSLFVNSKRTLETASRNRI